MRSFSLLISVVFISLAMSIWFYLQLVNLLMYKYLICNVWTYLHAARVILLVLFTINWVANNYNVYTNSFQSKEKTKETVTSSDLLVKTKQSNNSNSRKRSFSQSFLQLPNTCNLSNIPNQLQTIQTPKTQTPPIHQSISKQIYI